MTGEQYWNVRGRGFGGEPDGENTTSCAEENLLGYPGTRYFGSSICVHEFSHGIMRGAVYTVDPEYRKAVEDAYAAAKKQGLSSAQGYPGNNFNEYWATGIEAYVFGSGRGPRVAARRRSAALRARRQVIPSTKMPGNVYVGRTREANAAACHGGWRARTLRHRATTNTGAAHYPSIDVTPTAGERQAHQILAPDHLTVNSC